ncbi:MAG: metallophosphoesterase [Bacteroidota bacterium]
MRIARTVFFILICFLWVTFHPALGQKSITIGIFTDNQYCNCEVVGVRNYPASLAKLDSAIRYFNRLKVDAVFHLGDMIDNDFSSYDSVMPRYRKSAIPVNFVLGNHDYAVRQDQKEKVLPMLGLATGYYTRMIGDWKLIVLNGDDLSLFGPQDKIQKQERNDLLTNLVSGLRKNFMPWNGGLSDTQMKWFETQLQEAEKGNEKVIVLCHFPVYPLSGYNLWNNREVLALLTKYSCVKAYFNGHYHSGNYGFYEGIHFVNFKGMVNTEETAFALVTLASDSILIKGFGREPDRRLKIGRDIIGSGLLIPGSGDIAAVARVNGEPISVREFMLMAQKGRAEVIRFFRIHYNLEFGEDFWTQVTDGKSPSEMLKRRTLDTLVSMKLQQITARNLGLTGDISYKGFLLGLENENRRRLDAKNKGKVIFGPVQYSEEVYYDYLFSNLVIALKKKMNDSVFKINDVQVVDVYNKNRVPLGYGTLENCKSVIRRTLLDSAYSLYINDMLKKARVDTIVENYRQIIF